MVSSNTTRDHDARKEVAREEGVEGCSCCSWHVVRLGDHVMRAMCCSCIHRQSTGQSHDETAAIQDFGSWVGDSLKQSEAAVVAGPAVADNGLPMRFWQADVAARTWEERSRVFEAWAEVHFARQLAVVGELEEEVGGEAQVPAESLGATGLGLARHSRCRRTCCEMAPLAAL